MILFQINKGTVYRGRQQLTDEEILAIYKRLHLTNDMVQSTVGLLSQLDIPEIVEFLIRQLFVQQQRQ